MSLAFAGGVAHRDSAGNGGDPIGDPVVSYGPFVMNTEQEIYRAIEDFRNGGFGRLDA